MSEESSQSDWRTARIFASTRLWELSRALRFFLQGSARRLGPFSRAEECHGMDSFQKRDRQRRQLQKRREKEVKRRERAEARLHPRPDSGPDATSTDGTPTAEVPGGEMPPRVAPRETAQP